MKVHVVSQRLPSGELVCVLGVYTNVVRAQAHADGITTRGQETGFKDVGISEAFELDESTSEPGEEAAPPPPPDLPPAA